jgi:hypothetical protein
VFVSFYSALAPVTPAPVTPCPPPAGQQCRGQRLTSSQAFVSHSDDQGRTWSEPVPIAPAPSPTGLKRLWPVVTVSENEVDVVYYEINESPVPSGALCDVGLGGTLRRRGSAHSLVNTYVVRSKNGGASFGAPALVSSATSDWCTAQSNIRPNFGDYIGSTSAQSSILATWGDSRNGPVDTFFSRVQSND